VLITTEKLRAAHSPPLPFKTKLDPALFKLDSRLRQAGQKLASTGLYGIVRHPMYSGVVIMMIGTPLALDSLWGLAATALALPVLAARIFDEEKMLTEELAGYADYKTRVRSRLIPYVW